MLFPDLNSGTLLVYYAAVARFSDCDYSYIRERKKERQDHISTKVIQTTGHEQSEKK